MEEITKQKEFINKIKEINKNKYLKYNILTLGCQLNENDSEKLCGMLDQMGYEKVENFKDADICLFNTCCVRENAEERLLGKLGELKPDLTTTAHFAIQLSYPMSYLQHSLQARAGGLFVLVEGVGVDVQRGGGLAVAEDARHRGHIRAARDHQTGGGKAITIFLGK